MLKIHPRVEFETPTSQKKSISGSQKTHKDGPHLDYIYIDHNPIYAEDNPHVWVPELYNSTFYHQQSVKKWPFSNLKTKNDDFSIFECLAEAKGAKINFF